MPTLAHDIKQSAPFAAPEVEAFLNLQRTADLLHRQGVELLKPFGLSPTAYNVLRILRGAGPAGLPCSEVGARLVSHDPDITRLADRLAEAGLLARDRKPGDRRVVILRIDQRGLDLLAQLDPLTVDLARRQLSHLGGPGLETLIRLLELARHPPVASTPSPNTETP